MSRNKLDNVEWKGVIEEKSYTNFLFDHFVVRNADVVRVSFSDVFFLNSFLGYETKYVDCVFTSCKFYGKHSSLGDKVKFMNCHFINCDFTGNDLFGDQYFFNCSFSGLMKNIILKDKVLTKSAPVEIFDRCSLLDLTFNNVHIYGGNIFKDSVLPSSGLRLFDNSNNKLIKRAERICSEIDSDQKIESEIVFQKDLKSGQNPLILDSSFLNSFFKSKESREIFESIVSGYEL